MKDRSLCTKFTWEIPPTVCIHSEGDSRFSIKKREKVGNALYKAKLLLSLLEQKCT